MYSIHGSRSHAVDFPQPVAYRYPDIPFNAITLVPQRTERQLAILQDAMASLRHAGNARHHMQQPVGLSLHNVGLMAIHSSSRLMPRCLQSVSLDDNPYLYKLPNDLSDQLRWLSVRNDVALQGLPASLPHGLTIEIAGSGLTPDYLRTWAMLRPHAGVHFTHDGVDVTPAPAPVIRHAVQRERGNWDARAGREDDAIAVDQPRAFLREDYERDRYGAHYASARAARHDPVRPHGPDIIVVEVDDDDSASVASSDDGRAGAEPDAAALVHAAIGAGDYDLADFDLDTDSGSASGAASEAGFSDSAQEEDMGGFAMAELKLALAASLAEAGQVGPAADAGAHAAAMGECEAYLAHRMAFWLGDHGPELEASMGIARQCTAHLYALEDEDDSGAKRRAPHEIIGDHYARLNEFAQSLDRIRDTASFSNGSAEAQLVQCQKVADVLHLMAADKESCGTVLAAMQVAASTCADALATEGLDMLDAMCTTARAVRENWTPKDFYLKMEQQLKRDKVRALVGDIVKRMKHDYRAALLGAIEKNQRALNSSFRSAGTKLAVLVGDRHKVKRNGAISVTMPDPGESATYDASAAERKRYLNFQANKKVDDVEVLSLCQNKMQGRGLLADVQAGLYTIMHSRNAYSDTLNVKPAELASMARKLSFTRTEVLAKMAGWDHWTDYMDRHGHTDAVRNDPALKRHEADLTAQMNTLREDLGTFLEHADAHPEAAQDFALLNTLINAVGKPVVNAHERLSRGGDAANVITPEERKHVVDQGVTRVEQLEAEARAAVPPEPAAGTRRRTTAPADGNREHVRRHERDSDRHRSGHAPRSTHERTGTRRSTTDDTVGGSGRRRHGADRAAGAAPGASAPATGGEGASPAAAEAAPGVPFDKARRKLFKAVVKTLKEQGAPLFEATVLKKTGDLVLPTLEEAPPRRHHRTR